MTDRPPEGGMCMCLCLRMHWLIFYEAGGPCVWVYILEIQKKYIKYNMQINLKK